MQFSICKSYFFLIDWLYLKSRASVWVINLCLAADDWTVLSWLSVVFSADGYFGCKAKSWRAEVVMSLCLHVNLFLCSAQQHCPPCTLFSPYFGPTSDVHHPDNAGDALPSHWPNGFAVFFLFHLDLTVQDYFDIVKNPMDLSTIKRKLDTGQYEEPWQYIEDIWLMFNNAWLYNRKTSRVYKYCSKLAEVFETEIDPIMQGLGYCCGRKVSQD